MSKFADARLRYRLFIFTICLLASVSFWLLIKLSNEYTLSFKVPVTFSNVPSNRILTHVTDSSVQITLKAQGFKLLRLKYIDHPKPVSINLGQIGKNKTGEEITSNQLILPQVRRYSASLGFSNEIRSVFPEQIIVKLNRLYCKSVHVKLSTDISFAPQFLQFDSANIIPSIVTVFGTRAMVDSVKFARTEPIRIRNMAESAIRFVHLNSNTQKNKPYFIPYLIKVAIPVQKFTEVSLEVPIKLITQIHGQTIKIFPDKASVSCIVSMKDYKRLSPGLFTVSAVLMKSDNLYHLEVTDAPDFVRNVKVTPDKVEYLVLR